MHFEPIREVVEPLRPVYDVWMRFARVLGWINTRIILGAVFFTVFVVYRLLLAVSRKDPLRRKIDPDGPSYWTEKEGGNRTFDDFSKQF